jgi:hypothetical protein
MTIIQWDLATGDKVRTLEGHSDGVKSVCVSPDSKHMYSGSYDNTIIQWDLATGDKVRTFEGHSGEVNSVCVSADGKYIYSGSWDKTIIQWNLATGDKVHTFAFKGSVSCICFTPDSFQDNMIVAYGTHAEIFPHMYFLRHNIALPTWYMQQLLNSDVNHVDPAQQCLALSKKIAVAPNKCLVGNDEFYANLVNINPFVAMKKCYYEQRHGMGTISHDHLLKASIDSQSTEFQKLVLDQACRSVINNNDVCHRTGEAHHRLNPYDSSLDQG